MPEGFTPVSRSASPLPERSPSPNPFSPQPPQKTKSKASRRPFQSYAQPDLAAQKRAQAREQDSLATARAVSPSPYKPHTSAAPSVHDNIPRVPSPNIPGYGPPRSTTPNPYRAPSRGPSPNPYDRPRSRGPSPNPYQNHSRGPSPDPYHQDAGSSPPPPPPPHRSTYTPHSASNSFDRPNEFRTPRAVSPCPPSPGGGTGLTPSPLRTAMEDVMSSLEDMGASREDTKSPDGPIDPWSPEAFDQTYINAKRKGPSRPSTAMGIGSRRLDYVDSDSYADPVPPPSRQDQTPPQLSNYVERMENRLSKMHKSSPRLHDRGVSVPQIPEKVNPYMDRPKSSMAGMSSEPPKLRHKKSAYDVGRSMLGRTFTTKTNSTSASSGGRSTTTNGSSSTQMTDRSLMSGTSAGGFSSTSAGSLARKKEALRGRAQSALGTRKDNYMSSQMDLSLSRPQTPLTGISYHSSHASEPPRAQSQAGWHGSAADAGLGGLMTPKPKKSGFFKKIIESAKTGAATARSSIAAGEATRPAVPSKNGTPNGVTSIAGGFGNSVGRDAASEMGLGGNSGIDWVQVRRDVNRSNSLSRIELLERKERCQMMDYPAISPVDELFETTDGDEAADGNPVLDPTNFQAVNLTLVDKNARFLNSLPPMTNPVSLATGFVCRPYRSDVQRLRAIFTWVSEKITWEEEFESDINSRRVIQSKRGSPEDVSVLVLEMCAAVGITCEIIRGYLKSPGEVPELGIMPRANHWWNAVVVDGQWRFMDCSLASPSHPRRHLYSSVGSQTAEGWWFLTRPSEMCWTHVPEQHHQQHICPPVAHEVLLALPCACPPYFKNELQIVEYDTSLVRVEDLELVHIKFTVPADVECAAEVEARAFERDQDGDFFESGEVVKKRALAQAEWIGGQKRYTIKALLPGDEGQGILKVYAGKRGLMHSIKDIPHPLAFALPIIHTGDNPSYEFLTRHPTPHAQRHDLYVAQPQCQRLAVNNTFVFAVRQHPSSLAQESPNPGGTSPIPFIRPTSAMSITSSSASGSNPSTSSAFSSKKPAKLAIQSPGGKILRLMRKEERTHSTSQPVEVGDGGTWETIIKCGERGVWRGLVLADRSARWCVFAEWTCV
ncbi:hypothetical protein BP5796_00875 [Coleophoma crateriformis]|uniref:Transglutaminase-like domain-containing protein n=1 Tax=Coleophoma crateriformis TaxID=565419 RepID=A0A3D8T955_9HELO|nr:hypothetical protein BP5796_00875 [Coleophoma crateriformis]